MSAVVVALVAALVGLGVVVQGGAAWVFPGLLLFGVGSFALGLCGRT
jgi:hypothetical protein